LLQNGAIEIRKLGRDPILPGYGDLGCQGIRGNRWHPKFEHFYRGVLKRSKIKFKMFKNVKRKTNIKIR